MKKILALAVIALSIFLIYLSTIDKKVYYLSLTTDTKEPNYATMVRDSLKKKDLLEKYVSEFDGPNLRITDFSKMIDSNKTLKLGKKEQSIKNALIKADVVTLDVGRVDLFTKLAYEQNINTLYDYVDGLSNDLDTFLDLVRKYCKEDVFLLEIYNPSDIFPSEIIDYINDQYKRLAQKHHIYYVSYKIDSSMIQNKIELNAKGEESIFKSLNAQIENALFHK